MKDERRKINYDDLIIRYLAGTTSIGENKLLRNWMKTSEENFIYFNSLRDIWLSTAQFDPEALVMHYKSNNLITKINHQARENTFIKTNYKIINRVIQVAAVFLIFFLAALSGYLYVSDRKNNVHGEHITEIEATRGSKALTTLPDGTKVWLNAGSRLTYMAGYDLKTREVMLTGEAYFDVVPNAARPFVVQTGNLLIKALGTSFNVKAYPEDHSIVTTLVKGKVVIEGKDENNRTFELNLKPKESITYYTNQETYQRNIHVRNNRKTDNPIKEKAAERVEIKNVPAIKEGQVNTTLFTSWKDPKWIIERQSLNSLVQDLGRRYNIDIEILSDHIGQYHFTGTLYNETIEQVMVILRNTIPLTYKVEKGKITIDEDQHRVKEFKAKSSNSGESI